jgi:hypothetical protein
MSYPAATFSTFTTYHHAPDPEPTFSITMFSEFGSTGFFVVDDVDEVLEVLEVVELVDDVVLDVVLDTGGFVG